MADNTKELQTRSTAIGTWILFAVLFLLYVPALGMDFSLDDYFIIQNNKFTEDWRHIGTLLTEDLWAADPTATEQTSFYRPLFSLTLLIDRSIAGLNPMWHHAHSLLWFFLCVGLLLRILQRVYSSNIALLSVLIFALHPIQVETVAWVSARNDSMATAFTLGAILLLCRAKPKVFVGGLLCTCAFLSKENTILLPLWVGLLASITQAPRRKCIIAAVVGVGTAVLIRKAVGVNIHWPDTAHWELMLSNALPFVSDSLSLILFPWPLAPTRTLAWLSTSPIQHILTIVFLTLMISGSVWAWKKNRDNKYILLSGLFIFWGAWVPSVLATTINGFYGDRYLFLPLMGLALWIGPILREIKAPLKVTYLLFFLPCLVLITKKVPDWKDDHALWSSMARDISSPFSNASLAHIVYNQGDYKEAARLYALSFSHPQPWLAGCDTYVSSILNTEGPQRAYEQALWAIDRGCQQDGKMSGLIVLSLGLNQRWTELRETLPKIPTDPTRRAEIAFGAILYLDGREADLKSLRLSWGAHPQMDNLLLKMLRPEGVDELPPL